MLTRMIEKHPRLIRWTHWLNFALLAIMVWSGVLIYWANDVYRPFFPLWFYNFFRINHRLAEGMAIHFTFMWPTAVNGTVYFVYLLISGQSREIFPHPRSWLRLGRDAFRVALYDLGLAKELPRQDGIYNAAQKIAYSGILLMGMGSIASGLAIYKPIQAYWLTSLLGGYDFARLIHFVLAMGYVLFLIIHVIQVLRAGWRNLRSMIAGFDLPGEIK